MSELRDEVRAAKKELGQCQDECRQEKEKHVSVFDTLEKQKNSIKEEFETRKEELRDAEKLNFSMKEELEQQKIALKKQKKKMRRLIDDIQHVQMRDQSNLYRDTRNSRYRTPGADKGKLIEDATEKCDNLRELVLRRWQYREKIRKANSKIDQVKLKKQKIKKELSSMEDHEKELVRIANSLRQGIEALTAEATLKGTIQDSSSVRNNDLIEKTLESTDRLEEMLRRVPHEFEMLEEEQKETAVNPQYRWLLTELLQKIGLIYIGFNHQFLMHKGYRMDYQDRIQALKHKKYKLMNEIEIIEEQQQTQQENAQELIPQLKEDIARLKRNRETVTKQFKDFTQNKKDIENDILLQQKDIDNGGDIEETYSKLCKEVEDLRKQIDKNTDKMNKGGRVAISSLAYDAIKEQGVLDDDDDVSESIDQSRQKKQPRRGEGRTRGGPSRDEDDSKWGGGEYSDDDAPRKRNRSPVGHRDKKERAVSRSRSPPRKREGGGGGGYKTRGTSDNDDYSD